MDDFFSSLDQSFGQMLGWELVAVILAVSYLLLIMRENKLGWICALISTAIYTVLFWEVGLLMDSVLNIYYMAMAIYGWQQWQTRGQEHTRIPIVRWKPSRHAIVILVTVVATMVSGYLLSKNTEAAWPYLDSFTTWASVITTYMVAKKVLENWLYWIVIDTVALCLYIDRGLFLTALLLVAYLVICVLGFLNWKKTINSYELSEA
jgi:nicotinamide mononucleotide transporter